MRRGPLSVLALLLGSAVARGEDAAGGAAFAGPAYEEGMRLFDEAVRHVTAEDDGAAEVRTLHASFEVKVDLPDQHHEGGMRVWWAQPAEFRQELDVANAVTTKILSGDAAWIVDGAGRVARQHGTPDGERAVARLKDERARFGELARLLTLRGLKGPGIGFEFVGPSTGTAGTPWLKVIRRDAGRPDLTFWLAFTKDAQGVNRALAPGIVRVAGEPERSIPTKDYVLADWRSQGPESARRYPRKIEAYTIEPEKPAKRFLFASVREVRVDDAFPPSLFQPPP